MDSYKQALTIYPNWQPHQEKYNQALAPLQDQQNSLIIKEGEHHIPTDHSSTMLGEVLDKEEVDKIDS